MTSRIFKDIPSLQEVECSGGSLKPEVTLLSLQMHRLSDSKTLASLNVFLKTCVTLSSYSSCVIDNGDTHKSRLRVLVDDLAEGESRGYGCTVNTVKSVGNPVTLNWTIHIRRNSKCGCSSNIFVVVVTVFPAKMVVSFGFVHLVLLPLAYFVHCVSVCVSRGGAVGGSVCVCVWGGGGGGQFLPQYVSVMQRRK